MCLTLRMFQSNTIICWNSSVWFGKFCVQDHTKETMFLQSRDSSSEQNLQTSIPLGTRVKIDCSG